MSIKNTIREKKKWFLYMYKWIIARIHCLLCSKNIPVFIYSRNTGSESKRIISENVSSNVTKRLLFFNIITYFVCIKVE